MAALRDVKLPGRLGDPEVTLLTDGRMDPRILAVMRATGEAVAMPAAPSLDASYEDCLAFVAALEETIMAANAELLPAMPDFNGVTTVRHIEGVDGNDIALHIHEPASRSGELPCILHTHGGGMVFLTSADPPFVRWRNSLAELGTVVVGVEFRNGGGVLGNHPFPAGLNDCASAARWVHAHRAELGISSVVISGESGGGNLCIATALKADREGWLDAIDGVFAMCPYISGTYRNPPPEIVSLAENEGYLGDVPMMSAMLKVYDPEEAHATDPLAWPYHASPADLEGLPPHIISVNELDPIRDEGLIFARKLLAAGVPTVARTINGTPHAADMMYPDVTPELFRESLTSLHGFAASLAR